MRNMMCCLDLEGVLTPEIWIKVADETGIRELGATTRDEPDYGKLMRRRLAILKREGLGLRDIREVIVRMGPLPGAAAFLNKLREKRQVIILSDTYYEFAGPLIKQLAYPTFFCNRLITDKKGFITGYRLRQKDGKKRAVLSMKGLGFQVAAAGDSYNDIAMLKAADRGMLFRPPAGISGQFNEFPVADSYKELLSALLKA